MTSVRKAVKNCKKRMKQQNATPPENRLALKAILELFEKGTSSNLEYTNVGVIRSFAKVKSSNTRLERKKRKQGKWGEWREFRAYMKRQQESMLLPITNYKQNGRRYE